MKKLGLLAASAAMMMAATPAAADGYLGLEYGSSDLSFFGTGNDSDRWEGEGAFGWNGGGWGGQIGGSFGNVEFDTGGDSDYWTGDAHLYWDGGSWKLGGVIAGSDFNDFDVDDFVYGAEAMFNIGGSANLYGSLTAGEVTIFAGNDFDTWNADIGGNVYLSPNVRLGGSIGTGNIDGGGADADTFSAGVNGEFQPWSAPLSITVGYTHFEIDDISTDADTFRVGARWNFGGGSLQERNNATPFSAPGGVAQRLLGAY